MLWSGAENQLLLSGPQEVGNSFKVRITFYGQLGLIVSIIMLNLVNLTFTNNWLLHHYDRQCCITTTGMQLIVNMNITCETRWININYNLLLCHCHIKAFKILFWTLCLIFLLMGIFVKFSCISFLGGGWVL